MKRLLVLLAAVMAITGCQSGNVFSIEVGDCFDDEGAAEEITDVPIVDCSEPHDNEVFALIEMTEEDFPGFDATGAIADEECLPRFESYVGVDYAESDLEFGWLIPTETSWADGDREIVCILYRLDFEKMTGSMEGTGT